MDSLFTDLSFQAVAQAASIPLVLCNSQGEILFRNRVAEELLATASETWLELEWSRLSDWLKAPKGTRQLSIRGPCGVIPAEVAAAQMESAQGTNFALILLDQREHQRVRKELSSARDRLKLLSDQLVHAQEAERRHLAREIHDGLLQYVIGAAMYLDKVRSGGELTLLDTAALRLESAAVEGRRLIGELRPPSLQDFGLAATINEFWSNVGADSGIALEVRLSLDESELPDALKIKLFRMVQEAITNVLRHSHAEESELVLWREGDSLRVRMRDNGEGFKPHFTRGVGLSSIEERASLFGGCCWIQSDPGNTLVEISIPWSSVERKPSEEERRPEDILPPFFSRLRHRVETELRNPELPPCYNPLHLAEEELKALAHELQVYQIELEMQNEELRRWQSELEVERDRYRQLFEHAPMGYLALTPDFKVCQANLAACELLERERDDLMGTSLEALVCTWSREQLKELLELGSGQKKLWMRKRRSRTQARVKLELRECFEGEESTRLAVICDLSEHSDPLSKRLQWEQESSSKRAKLGLTVAETSCSGLDLNAELTDFYDTLRTLAADRTLRVRLGTDLPPVQIDPATLRILVTNLVQNAVDGGSAVITLTTRALGDQAEGTTSFVGLDISDTGEAINLDLWASSFEVNATTRDLRQLRLLEVLYLVKQGQGEVRVLSEPERGTTVRILLPPRTDGVEKLT